ncbi:MAG: putative MarR family transcriptional regulator [Pseudonocardia sp.]|nr:putative MarR family transcriptional regulator [Pseudonocardia sp.]
MSAEENLTSSFAFQLSKLGQYATDRFAERIAPLGLRPRHCGVLAVLQAGQPAQLDIASALGVSNSVVVNMLDELEDLGAVRRVRETEDRRRQRVELTAHGRTLAGKAARLAHELDTDLLASLGYAQATTLREAFRALAKQHGLPGG